MKPVSIRFQCFGPYMDQQYIDFSRLEQNGLFLICGETGAGKTTILDAMCYALYGKSSGGLRGDLSVMRCKLAGKTDETLVEFIFDSDGKRYKFTRSLKYGRKNLNDSHNCMELREGEYVPIFANPKATAVNQKAQELIGLTYDQFRQVIILPQGQFEKLLVSDSAEKEKILVSLFHADRWQRIAEELYRRVMERDAAAKLEKQSITLKLKEYGCESLAQLAEKAARTRLDRDEGARRTAAAKEALDRARQLQEQALLENQGFEELARREKTLARLLPQVRHFDSEEANLNLADLAEQIRPRYAAYQDARNQKLRAEGRLRQAEAAQAKAEAALDNARAEQQRHEAARPGYEQRKRQITVLEEARDLYESLAQKQAAAQQAQTERGAKNAALDKAAREFERLETAWQQALADQERAIRDYQQAQQLYLLGIGSILAQRLEPGRPCPVCGSTGHPCPAKPTDGHISDARLEAYNQAMNRANDAVTRAMRARSDGETRQNQAQTAYNEASQAAALAQQDWEAALAKRLKGIESARQLEEQLARLIRQTAEFEKKDAALLDAHNDALSGQKAAEAGRDAAIQELTAAQTAYAAQAALWQEALASSGLENESQYTAATMEPGEQQRRRGALIQFRTDLSNAQQALEEQKALLAGKTAPDPGALKQALAAREKAYTEESKGLALLEQRLEAMERDSADLSARVQKLEQERQAVDGDLEFANRLRGRTGIGLQRYVLGVMLTSITVAANRLLKNVYGGRYQLYRTNEIAGSGHKGGLELEVLDAANNERRSVTTLSGGEKFLVALSLAIGLSTVVQAQGQGIRLEAMFVDEGFGSLDREAVNDALEVLQGIQRSAGVVGIISHVEQLAEVIPTRIEIIKGENGSRCKISG